MPALQRNAPARAAVRAAAKRNAGGGRGAQQRRKKSQQDEVAQFEQLMEDWDDAFAADCDDSERAAVVATLAEDGHRQHGRGFVFVRSSLERKSRKSTKEGSFGGSSAAKGFGAAAQTPAEQGSPLPNNPQLRLLSWTATFIPGSALDSGVGGVFTAADGALLPDSGSLLAGSSLSSGSGSSSGSTEGGGQGGAAAVEELQRVMRGQDTSQLRALVGLPPLGSPAAGGGSSSSSGEAGTSSGSSSAEAGSASEASAAEAEGGGMMGLRRYEPDAGELVVLLSARVSGKPALGAELLVVARGEDGAVTLQLPDGWEEALAMA
ncbi:hypothetical protein ABPG75_003237 [Micractinium tetrahymenae]